MEKIFKKRCNCCSGVLPHQGVKATAKLQSERDVGNAGERDLDVQGRSGRY